VTGRIEFDYLFNLNMSGGYYALRQRQRLSNIVISEIAYTLRRIVLVDKNILDNRGKSRKVTNIQLDASAYKIISLLFSLIYFAEFPL
jgi:hypothetical protein